MADPTPNPEVPAPAAPAPPAALAPEPPAAPAPRKVKYNHKVVEVPPDQVDPYITKGMAAAKLEEDRAAFKAEQAANAQKLQIAETVLEIQRLYPDRWKTMLAASQGEKLRPVKDDDDFSEDEPLTRRQTPSTLPAEYERRLAGIEQGYQNLQTTLHQRDLQTQIDAAIAAQPYLRENPGMAASLRERIEDGLAAGRYQSPSEAAMVLATEQKDLLQSALEREHAAREERLQAAAPPQGSPVMVRPEIDKSKLTFKSLKDGSFREAMRESLRKVGAPFTPPN